MAKVYVVTFHRQEKKLNRGWLAKLLGLEDVWCGEYTLGVFDTEDKAKDCIREWIANDRELNVVRKRNDLNVTEYTPNVTTAEEREPIVSYRHRYKNVRTTVWYEYKGYDVK